MASAFEQFTLAIDQWTNSSFFDLLHSSHFNLSLKWNKHNSERIWFECMS